MREYYNILHYLTHFRVDRQYPYNFQETTGILPSGKIELTSQNKSLHSNSLKCSSLTTEDSLVIPTLSKKYNTVDDLELKILSSIVIDPSLIRIGFSESKTGENPVIVCTPQETDDIESGAHSLLSFKINYDQRLADTSKKLSNISSIVLNFNQAISTVFITDIVFKTREYICTLEDLEKNIIEGQDHIKIGLGSETIPSSLGGYVYVAAAAFSWLIKWEQEAKVMDTGAKESKNYADRLLGRVDRAIKQYLNQLEEEETDSEDYINENLIGSENLTW
jgi:hypothetical protein